MAEKPPEEKPLHKVSQSVGISWESLEKIAHLAKVPIEIAPPAGGVVRVTAGGVSVGGVGPAERIAAPPPVVERLTEYGWTILFEDQSDGRVRGYLCDAETREILKSEVADDFEDAYLALGVDLKPPSHEGRSGRADDPRDPRQ